MKVLYISIEFTKLHIQIIESISKKDIEVLPFNYSLRREKKTNVSYDLTYECFPLSLFRGPLFYIKRLRYIAKKCYTHFRNENIDIICGHMLFCDGYICNYLSEKLGIPYIVSVRNTDINLDFLWRNPLIKSEGLKVIRNAGKLIFINHSYFSQLISKVPGDIKPCVSQKSVVIPNGVDAFWLENLYQAKDRNNCGVFCVLTVGRIERNKNQLNTARAIDCLIKKGHKIKYTIIGENCDSKYLTELNKFGFVDLIPPMPKEKLIDYYKKADLFAMPSFTETFGLTYVEAISQNCPVLYSENQGFDGFFPEGMVGFHVDSNSIDSIENGILAIMNSDFSDISKYALDFSWDNFSKKTTDLYVDVLRRKQYR